MTSQRHVFGSFALDTDRGVLTRDGAPLPIGAKAMTVLGVLLGAGNRVVGKHELIEAAWPDTAIEDSNLSVQIANLRKLLGTQPDGSQWIATVPRAGYRFAGRLGEPAAAPSARPLVAILPFVSATAGAIGRDLALTITEDIAAALASFQWFTVTRRDSPAARYHLEGSVRAAGDSIRIAVHLVDAASGAHLFDLRLDTIRADLLAAHDDIARRVAGAIEPALLRSDGGNGDGSTALDLVRRGTGLFHRLTEATHAEARLLFRDAIRLNPYLAEAHSWLARVSAGMIAYGWVADPPAAASEGLSAGLTAVRLDPTNPYAHYGLAIVSVYADMADQAANAAQRAIELSDSFALGHLVLGLARLAQGGATEAIDPLRRGLELSPADPQAFAWLNFLALAQLFSGDAAAGAASAGQLVRSRPDWRPGFATLAACEAALHRFDAAQRSATRMAGLPRPRGDTLAPIFSANPGWAARLAGLLETAGGSPS